MNFTHFKLCKLSKLNYLLQINNKTNNIYATIRRSKKKNNMYNNNKKKLTEFALFITINI